MIVKDEEHVIERALHSCVDLIDAYCIVDTGSTDKTKEIINAFFAKHKRIKGEIIDYPFTTYAECRNVSLEEAKKHGDWGFWMDADEELILKNYNRNTFKASVLKDKPDQILLSCLYGGLKYNRAQLFKLKEYTWYGPVHEVLRSDKKNQVITEFKFGHMFIRAEGNSWNGDISEKYEGHANILLDYQIKNNWEDPRWTFYLAQSYKDSALSVLNKKPKDVRGLDLAKKAINFYRDRINSVDKGFIQEMYYSQLMIARISFYFMPIENVIYEFNKCEEYNWDNRIEHIFDLTSIYQQQKLWRTGKIQCDYAHNILNNGGTNASLFVEKDIYTWRFYDAFSIILYYCGFSQESLKLIDFILKRYDKIIPDEEFKRITNNKTLTENSLSK